MLRPYLRSGRKLLGKLRQCAYQALKEFFHKTTLDNEKGMPAIVISDDTDALARIGGEYLYYEHRGFALKTQSPQSSRDLLLSMVHAIRNGLIVEVGVFGGATLVHLAQVCEDNKTRLVGIDPWETLQRINGVPINLANPDARDALEALRNVRLTLDLAIKSLGYQHIQLVQGFSVEVVNDFVDETVDVLFLDGDHSVEGLYQDLQMWYPKMKPASMMLGDDADWPSVHAAVGQFCSEKGIAEKLHDHRTWSISVTKCSR